MEHVGSLPHSQVPATCPYPESARSSPYHFLNSILILSSHLQLGLPSGLFPLGFPIKTLYIPLPLRATRPAHLFPANNTYKNAFCCDTKFTTPCAGTRADHSLFNISGNYMHHVT